MELNCSNAEKIRILEASLIEINENLTNSQLSFENCLMDSNKKEQTINEMIVSFYIIKNSYRLNIKLFFKEREKLLVETCSVNEENISYLDSIIRDLKEQIIENKENYDRFISEANETTSKLISDKIVSVRLFT